MPKHFLDCTDISAAIDHVSGRCMAENVGPGGACAGGSAQQRVEIIPNLSCSSALAADADEEGILGGMDPLDAPAAYPMVDRRHCRDSYGDSPLFIAFTCNGDSPAFGVDVTQIESTEFCNAHPGAVQQLDDGTVSQGSYVLGVLEDVALDEFEKLCDVLSAQHFGKGTMPFRRLDSEGGVRVDFSPAVSPGVERAGTGRLS